MAELRITPNGRAHNTKIELDGRDITRFVSGYGLDETDITKRQTVSLRFEAMGLTVDGDALVLHLP